MDIIGPVSLHERERERKEERERGREGEIDAEAISIKSNYVTTLTLGCEYLVHHSGRRSCGILR